MKVMQQSAIEQNALNNSWKNYLHRRKHSTSYLSNAGRTSIEEIFEIISELRKKPGPVSALKFVKKITTSGIWVSQAAFRFLISLLDIKEDKFRRLQHPHIQRILFDVRDNIPLDPQYATDEQIFGAIFLERQFYHYHSEMKAILDHPHLNCTIVLVDGVLNEIFSTSTFERALKALHQKYGIKFFIPNINGLKSTKENANSLRIQIEEYVEQNPNEKLWMIGYSKGGIDSLHFAYENSNTVPDYLLGISTVACPILGSDKFEHMLVKFIKNLHTLEHTSLYQKFRKKGDFLYRDLMLSLDQEIQGNWFKKNYTSLPKNVFYTALALESHWYESHFWMMLSKALFNSKKRNDGIVSCESAQFPEYFRGINLGIAKGHHLVGTRSSFYSQEALIEAHIIFLKYKNLIN